MILEPKCVYHSGEKNNGLTSDAWQHHLTRKENETPLQLFRGKRERVALTVSLCFFTRNCVTLKSRFLFVCNSEVVRLNCHLIVPSLRMLNLVVNLRGNCNIYVKTLRAVDIKLFFLCVFCLILLLPELSSWNASQITST